VSQLDAAAGPQENQQENAQQKASENPLVDKQDTSDIPDVMSFLLLRKLVGIIGMLLPFVLIAGNAIIGDDLQASMSGYYYTSMRNIFVGALCGLGIFLVTYNGYDRPDRIITNIAGAGAICVAFFPTSPAKPTSGQSVIGDLHLAFAFTVFAMLAVMSLRFAKRSPTPERGLGRLEKISYALGFTPPGTSTTPALEIAIYRGCGLAIIVCIALVKPLANVGGYSLLVLEAIMLVAFGTSWFVKGKHILPVPVKSVGR
jgi:hypothetical protein